MRPIPDDEQLVNLIRSLLANAQDLVADAALLFENERYARTYALSALAGEELGKIYLCMETLFLPQDVTAKEFWARWRAHGDKLGAARAYAAAFVDDLAALDPKALASESKTIGDRKMAAIYVDLVGGSITTPLTVDRGEARGLLERTQRSVSHAQMHMSGLSVEIVALLRNPPNGLSVLSDLIDRTMAERLPPDALEAMRHLLDALPDLTGEEAERRLRELGA